MNRINRAPSRIIEDLLRNQGATANSLALLAAFGEVTRSATIPLPGAHPRQLADVAAIGPCGAAVEKAAVKLRGRVETTHETFVDSLQGEIPERARFLVSKSIGA